MSCCVRPSSSVTCCDKTSPSCCEKSPSSSSSSPTACCETSCCEVSPAQKATPDFEVPSGEELKQQVRADYAKVATASAHNADAVAAKFGYTQADLAALPHGANMGVSCGNPLALTHVKEGEVVVDLGCGRGMDVFLASLKVGSSGKVYGIDMTPEMLAQARASAEKRNITNVEFLQGDIEQLPIPSNTVDLVISNCVINLVPNKQKAFNEIYRILKPGGRVAVSDILQRKPLPEDLRDKVELLSTCFIGAMFLNDVTGILQQSGFQGILVSDANVDLNAYKMLGDGGGCCGSVEGSLPMSELTIDLNEYAASGKIFACK